MISLVLFRSLKLMGNMDKLDLQASPQAGGRSMGDLAWRKCRRIVSLLILLAPFFEDKTRRTLKHEIKFVFSRWSQHENLLFSFNFQFALCCLRFVVQECVLTEC